MLHYVFIIFCMQVTATATKKSFKDQRIVKTTATVVVTIINENDNSPKFDEAAYNASVLECATSSSLKCFKKIKVSLKPTFVLLKKL